MIYAIAVVLVLIVDQAVKFWTTKNIMLNAAGADCKELIPGLVRMTNIHNNGAAFSIMQDARWLLIVITVIFVIAIIVLINREIIRTKFGCWTAVLVLAGALGNCIDRIMYGYVVDMFEFEFFNFPIFNVADMFITVCGILFIIHVLFHKEPEEVKEANQPEFVRRRREEKAAKEEPYSRIPKRGVHTTLEEDLQYGETEEDPFEDWEFGDLVDDVVARKAEQEAARPLDAMSEDDLAFLLGDDVPVADPKAPKSPAAKEKNDPYAEELFKNTLLDEPWEELDLHWDLPNTGARQQAPEQEPLEKEPPTEEDDDPIRSYSVEDILSEFEDL